MSKPNFFKFNGNEEQTEFDFNVFDFNARFYDANLGRFMNIDPLADQREWINPYNYVQNNPLIRVDPAGTKDWYTNEAGETKYDENIKSQEDLEDAGIEGTYQGDEGWGGIDKETGKYTHYNKDGSTTKVAKDLGEVVVTPNPVEEGVLKAGEDFMDHPVTKAVKFTATTLISGGLLNSYKVFNTAKLTSNLVRGSSVASKGTNVVYQGLDGAGKVRYVGITSRAPQARFGEHLNSLGTGKELLNYRVVPGAANLSRTGARVIEQQLINQNGLGQLLNKINSISPSKWALHGIK